MLEEGGKRGFLSFESSFGIIGSCFVTQLLKNPLFTERRGGGGCGYMCVHVPVTEKLYEAIMGLRCILELW